MLIPFLLNPIITYYHIDMQLESQSITKNIRQLHKGNFLSGGNY